MSCGTASFKTSMSRSVQVFSVLFQLALCALKKSFVCLLAGCRYMLVTQVLLSDTALCAVSPQLTELHSVGVYRVGVSWLPADQRSFWTARALPLLDHRRRWHWARKKIGNLDFNCLSHQWGQNKVEKNRPKCDFRGHLETTEPLEGSRWMTKIGDLHCMWFFSILSGAPILFLLQKVFSIV